MDKEELIDSLSPKIKLIRVEKNYTQDQMATILGISKKTLVQIEKGRMKGNWTTIVALCALFRDSEILQNTLGEEDVVEVIETVAHFTVDRPISKTMGGKIWWLTVMEEGAFTLQQNVVTKHFRIIDQKMHRWYSTFDEQEAKKKFLNLAQG